MQQQRNTTKRNAERRDVNSASISYAESPVPLLTVSLSHVPLSSSVCSMYVTLHLHAGLYQSFMFLLVFAILCVKSVSAG